MARSCSRRKHGVALRPSPTSNIDSSNGQRVSQHDIHDRQPASNTAGTSAGQRISDYDTATSDGQRVNVSTSDFLPCLGLQLEKLMSEHDDTNLSTSSTSPSLSVEHFARAATATHDPDDVEKSAVGQPVPTGPAPVTPHQKLALSSTSFSSKYRKCSKSDNRVAVPEYERLFTQAKKHQPRRPVPPLHPSSISISHEKSGPSFAPETIVFAMSIVFSMSVNLRELRLVGATLLTAEKIAIVISQCPSLKHLTVSGSCAVSPITFLELFMCQEHSRFEIEFEPFACKAFEAGSNLRNVYRDEHSLWTALLTKFVPQIQRYHPEMLKSDALSIRRVSVLLQGHGSKRVSTSTIKELLLEMARYCQNVYDNPLAAHGSTEYFGDDDLESNPDIVFGRMVELPDEYDFQDDTTYQELLQRLARMTGATKYPMVACEIHGMLPGSCFSHNQRKLDDVSCVIESCDKAWTDFMSEWDEGAIERTNQLFHGNLAHFMKARDLRTPHLVELHSLLTVSTQGNTVCLKPATTSPVAPSLS